MLPAYTIRTDRFDIAIDAKDKIEMARTAEKRKRSQTGRLWKRTKQNGGRNTKRKLTVAAKAAKRITRISKGGNVKFPLKLTTMVRV